MARAEALGFAWTAVSTPFVRIEGERVVGHVGIIELPLVVGGRVLTEGPEDLRLLRRLLADRAPVSERFGSREDCSSRRTGWATAGRPRRGTRCPRRRTATVGSPA